MKDVTNKSYLAVLRTATEIVEELTLEQVNSSIDNFDEDTKRSILSQKLAMEMLNMAIDISKKVKEAG